MLSIIYFELSIQCIFLRWKLIYLTNRTHSAKYTAKNCKLPLPTAKIIILLCVNYILLGSKRVTHVLSIRFKKEKR